MTARGFVLVYFLANLGLILYGILAAVFPSAILAPISVNVSPIPTELPPLASYISGLVRLLGYFNILVGSIGMILLRGSRGPGHDWVIRPLILLTALAYIGPIIFDNTVAYVGAFEALEIVILLAAIATGIPQWRRIPRSMAA